MILVGIGIISLLGAWLLAAWRRVEACILRWKLYALRDRLRLLVIDRHDEIDRSAFERLDCVFSVYCDQTEILSFWAILPIAVAEFFWGSAFKTPTDLTVSLDQPENREMAECHDEAAKAIQTFLLKRHVVLVILLVPTIVGPWLLYRGIKAISDAVASGNFVSSNRTSTALISILGRTGAAR